MSIKPSNIGPSLTNFVIASRSFKALWRVWIVNQITITVKVFFLHAVLFKRSWQNCVNFIPTDWNLIISISNCLKLKCFTVINIQSIHSPMCVYTDISFVSFLVIYNVVNKTKTTILIKYRLIIMNCIDIYVYFV